mmetsp:Transcript_45928/g.33679  ORF Transcript_45928/g.33679 Transcript_45928/m.33679 type:complete len:99 (-) Transcript_45928:438-734(-)
MNGYAYMAMTNYPYPSDFLEPMPGYPVNVAAAFFDGISPTVPDPVTTERKQEVLNAIWESTNIYFNYDNRDPDFCTDLTDWEGTGNLDGFGWNVLACN